MNCLMTVLKNIELKTFEIFKKIVIKIMMLSFNVFLLTPKKPLQCVLKCT